MVKAVYRFHMYYHARRILKRLQVLLPHEAGFNAVDNPYTNEEFFKICENYGVPHDSMRYRNEKFYWTYYQRGVGWDPAICDKRLDDQRKTRSQTRSRFAEMGHFLQITITRKTRPFLKKTYTISPDRKLQKWVTFCKLRSQEKLYHFSRETIEFLVFTKCRNGPLSANYDLKKN